MKISVVRLSFFDVPSRGHLRWTEASPAAAHRHGGSCGCTVDADVRPAGRPAQVRQEIRIAWDDCVVQLEDEVNEPRVVFRRKGDTGTWIDRRATGADARDEADLSAFWFEAHQRGVKLEVPSPGFGSTGVVLAHVYQGNQIDVSRFSGGWRPSRTVDLSKLSEDQVWIHSGLWDAMRLLEDPEETRALREVLRLSREVRERARPYARNLALRVDEVRTAVEADGELGGAATNLRQLLRPFALDVARTELFRRAGEIEAEAAAKDTAAPDKGLDGRAGSS